mmetsp:Transcript_63584/g.124829  ORF Transcript_63584/g.124829 Transcript_63584/m.124829 type:complete len:201 (+) Transcript_63584:617-1219(+)
MFCWHANSTTSRSCRTMGMACFSPRPSVCTTTLITSLSPRSDSGASFNAWWSIAYIFAASWTASHFMEKLGKPFRAKSTTEESRCSRGDAKVMLEPSDLMASFTKVTLSWSVGEQYFSAAPTLVTAASAKPMSLFCSSEQYCRKSPSRFTARLASSSDTGPVVAGSTEPASRRSSPLAAATSCLTVMKPPESWRTPKMSW